MLYTRSFNYLSVYVITIYSYSETIFMLFADIIVFGYIPDLFTSVGACIIIGSCVVMAID